MPTDPRGLREDAPLLDAWLRFQESPTTPFTLPGHKRRTDLVGDVVAGDVPLYAGLDTMQLSTGVERLAAALVTSIESGRSAPRPVVGAAAYRVDPVPVVPPCQAFFAPVESVPLADAVGRTSAELVAPYPPGIPVLAPGEEGRPPASRVTNLSGQYT